MATSESSMSGGAWPTDNPAPTSLAQGEERKTRRLTMPVLVIGGTASVGDLSAKEMKLVADDVQSVIIPGAGHWLAEEAPDEFLAALTAFLAPYRDAAAVAAIR